MNFNANDLINLRYDGYRLNGIKAITIIIHPFCLQKMISDVQLAIFANLLGVSVFLLVVLYHYIAANNPKSHTS